MRSGTPAVPGLVNFQQIPPIASTAWYVGPLLPLFYDREAYFSSPSMSQMGPEYVAGLDAFLSPAVLIGFDIATVILGFIGGVIALGLLRKNFARAGLA